MSDLEQSLVAPAPSYKPSAWKGWCAIVLIIFCTLLCITAIGFSMYIIYTLIVNKS